MTRALVRNKISPIVVTTNEGQRDGLVKLNSWKMTNYGKVIYVKRFVHYLPVRAAFVSIGQMKNADVVHLTSLFYPLSWITAISNHLFFQKPVVWSIRGELSKTALGYSSWKKKPILYLIKKLLKYVTFHGTSNAEILLIQEHFGYNVSACKIPNLIEIPKLEEKNDEDKYFLYVGRIHKIKGLENLLNALSDSEVFLKSEFSLRIAGKDSGEYAQQLKLITLQLGLENKVLFVGHVEGKCKQTLYRNAHFLVLPSFSENFGNVVVESMAQKTPVIASKGTPWKRLISFQAGFWVENSIIQLKLAINKAIKLNEQEYKAYSDNAYDLVKDKFDVERGIHKWIDVYKTKVDENISSNSYF